MLLKKLDFLADGLFLPAFTLVVLLNRVIGDFFISSIYK